MQITIPFNYSPYQHQVGIFKARDEGINHIFTRWHRRCFVGETPIAMADGSWKNIQDIKVGDLVLSYNNSKLEPKMVIELFDNGEQEVNEYNDLICTPNHKVLTVFNTYKEIDKTDHLINAGMLSFGNIYDPDLAEVLGLLLTDGYINVNQSPKFTNTNIDLLNRFDLLVKKVFKDMNTTWYKKGNGFDVVCTTKVKTNYHPIRQYFKTSNTLPDIIWSMDYESTLAFLAGVIAGDGSISFYRTTTPRGFSSITGQLVIEAGISEELAKDYKKLLLKFGIRAKIKKDPRGNNWRVYVYSLKSLHNISKIQIPHKEKQKKFLEVIQNSSPYKNFKQEKIKKGNSYKARTFDITVEDNHNYIANGYIVHNSGKDKTYWNLMIREAAKRKGMYWYFLPELKQARDTIWDAMDNDGFRFLDHIPPELRAKEPNNSDMKIELSNGSLIKLQGTDKFENRRGANPVGVIYSEYAYQNPAVRKMINPILKANGGWEALNSTPNGKNHMFHLEQTIRSEKLNEESVDLKHRWYLDVKTMDETFRFDGTPIFNQDDYIAELREGNTEEFLQQEYYVSYNANAQGYYYLSYINDIRDNGQIGKFPFIPDLPVTTYWDIGVGDSTAIWFMQWQEQKPVMIDFYQNFSVGIDHYASILMNGQRTRYAYKRHVFPHDIINTEFGTGKSRFEVAQQLFGSEKCDIGPKLGFDDGIQAVRYILPRTYFDENENTIAGIEALENYQRQYDDTKKEFSARPIHNWASHPADAFRYYAVDAEKPKEKNKLSEKLRAYRRKFGSKNWKIA
jgi:hypothetical protein